MNYWRKKYLLWLYDASETKNKKKSLEWNKNGWEIVTIDASVASFGMLLLLKTIDDSRFCSCYVLEIHFDSFIDDYTIVTLFLYVFGFKLVVFGDDDDDVMERILSLAFHSNNS